MITDELLDEIFSDSKFKNEYIQKVKKHILDNFEKNIDMRAFYQRFNREIEEWGEDLANNIIDDLDLSGVQKEIEKKLEWLFKDKKKTNDNPIKW